MLFHVLQVFDNLENCHVDLHPVDAVLGSPPENLIMRDDSAKLRSRSHTTRR